MTILIVEDDLKIREELTILLQNNGYKVMSITDFQNVVTDIKNISCDLILMDINLPYLNGFDICREVKKTKAIPILFVTSRNTEEDELKTIVSGGSDFIAKPYNKMILLQKIARCLNNNDLMKYKELIVKGVTLDLHLSTVYYNNKEIELTRNEFRILYYLFLNHDSVLSKDTLVEYLWNDKYYLDENILLVNINRLRRKLEDIGLPSDFIKTIRGKGYMV